MGSLELLEEACEDLPHTKRAMFGGHGLFAPHGGIFAAIVDEDRIVLKFADDALRAAFEALGARAWTYAEKMTMREWLLVPDDLYDEPRSLAEWARRAHAAAPPPAKKKATKGAKAPATKTAKKPSKKAASKSPARKKAGATKRPRGR